MIVLNQSCVRYHMVEPHSLNGPILVRAVKDDRLPFSFVVRYGVPHDSHYDEHERGHQDLGQRPSPVPPLQHPVLPHHCQKLLPQVTHLAVTVPRRDLFYSTHLYMLNYYFSTSISMSLGYNFFLSIFLVLSVCPR